ncbi:MAG: cellulose biosynthesis protein BcsS [Pseudolabrys sp.]
MRCRRRIGPAVAAVAALVVCCVCLLPRSARAGDDGLAHFLLFSRRDLWRKGAFASGGLHWAPHGRETDGCMLMRGHFELMAFAGLDVEVHKLWPDDPGNSLRGTSYGLALAAALWDQPTPNTMLAADASFSTIGHSYASRLAFGWRLFGQFYAGPETQVYGGDGYRQFRLGAHITSFKTGTDEWSAAVGWAIDTDHRESPYVRLGLTRRL